MTDTVRSFCIGPRDCFTALVPRYVTPIVPTRPNVDPNHSTPDGTYANGLFLRVLL